MKVRILASLPVFYDMLLHGCYLSSKGFCTHFLFWDDFTPEQTKIINNTFIATASIDFTSDKLIQSTLKTKFPSTTILCIAHRISTLVWMDRILVMEDGRIVEDGSPSDLLEQAGDGESRFRGLMRASGDDFLRKMIEEAREGQNDRKDVQGN